MGVGIFWIGLNRADRDGPLAGIYSSRRQKLNFAALGDFLLQSKLTPVKVCKNLLERLFHSPLQFRLPSYFARKFISIKEEVCGHRSL